LKRLGPGNLAALGGNDVDHPDNPVVVQCENPQGYSIRSRLWETRDMRTPELTDVGWLGPRIEMDSASHCFGKCSECQEIICVEKVVTDSQNTQPKTTEMLYKVFRTHVTLKHSEEMNQSAARIVREATKEK
jgi:hypothetical protein